MKVSWPWRSLIPLVCGLCAAIGAVWLVQQHIEQQLQQQIPSPAPIASLAVVVPATDLAAGTVLRPEHLQVRDLPLQALPEDVVKATTAGQVFSRQLGVAVGRGRPLQYLHLRPTQADRLSEVLKPGQRAFALPLGAGSSSGRLVTVGDQVDLYEQREQGFIPLLQAKVIATGDKWQSASYSDGPASVTLAVPVEKIARLEFLNRHNALAFWLRNSNDNGPLPDTTEHSMELIIAGQKSLEVW